MPLIQTYISWVKWKFGGEKIHVWEGLWFQEVCIYACKFIYLSTKGLRQLPKFGRTGCFTFEDLNIYSKFNILSIKCILYISVKLIFTVLYLVSQMFRFFVTAWTVAYQAPPSMGFSRQEYWSGVPLPSPHMNDHHDKCSNHLLYKYIAVLLLGFLCCSLHPHDLFIVWLQVCTS